MITVVVIIAVIIVALLFPGWSVELISSGPYLKAMDLNQTAERSSSSLEHVMKKLKVLYHKEGVSTKFSTSNCKFYIRDTNKKGSNEVIISINEAVIIMADY